MDKETLMWAILICEVGFILGLHSLTFNKNHKNLSPSKHGIYSIYSNFEYIYIYICIILIICMHSQNACAVYNVITQISVYKWSISVCVFKNMHTQQCICASQKYI